MMSLLLLCGNLSVPAAVAEGTQYYTADGWVLLAPTVAPAETSAAVTSAYGHGG